MEYKIPPTSEWDVVKEAKKIATKQLQFYDDMMTKDPALIRKYFEEDDNK